LKKKDKKQEDVSPKELRKIFKDIIESLLIQVLLDGKPVILTQETVFYNKLLRKAFAIQMVPVEKAKHLSSIFPQGSNADSLNQISLIPDFLNSNPAQTNVTGTSKLSFLENEEKMHEPDNLFLISNVLPAESEEEQSRSLKKPMFSIGQFFVDIWRKTQNNFDVHLDSINEEDYLTFNENYYLDINNLSIYKSKNNFHFFLASDEKKRIDLLKLAFYLDLSILRPSLNCPIGYHLLSITYFSRNSGKIVYPNGYIYEGEVKKWKKGIIREGKGILKNTNDFVIYKGSWKKNLFHGHGQLRLFDNQCYYEGDFEEGRCHGFGKLFYHNTLLYEGQFILNNYFFDFFDLSNLEKDISVKDTISTMFRGYLAFEGPYLINSEAEGITYELLSIVHCNSKDKVLVINLMNFPNDSQLMNKVAKWFRLFEKFKNMHFFLK